MKNNKKSIIIFSCLIVLSVAFIFIFGSNLTRLLGNMYNIDEIGANIDNIKSGDKINYTANGVDDWEVLSVDKASNIIEIVSTKPVEDLELGGYEGWLSAKEKMLEIANKYGVGDNVVGTRNLNLNDITSSNISFSGCFWLDDQVISKYTNTDVISGYSQKYYCRGNSDASTSYNINIISDVQVMVIVNVTDVDARSYSVGDDYIYSSNGIDDWKVLSVNSDNDLLVVSTEGQFIDFATNEALTDATTTINNYLLDFYDNDNVLNVRIANYNDANMLSSAGIKNTKNVITGFTGYSGSYSYSRSYLLTTDSNETHSYTEKYDSYKFNIMYYSNYSSSYSNSTITFPIYSNSYGVRPVIRLKYSVNDDNDNEELNTNIKIGDNVIYEANSYKNWKVLSINKEDNTAEIVSGGIVQLLTLRGINDYNNVESIFQEVVDDYMEGDNVVSARMLISDDIESLSSIKDRYSGIYWLGNKLVYKYKNGVITTNNDLYGVAVASYNSDSLNILRQWVTLEVTKDGDAFMSSLVGSFEYTAGIRPVIKVKLSSLVKDEEVNGSSSTKEYAVVPENKEKPVPDENIVISNEETNDKNVDNNEKDDEEFNSCIVYDNDKATVNNEVVNDTKVDNNSILILSVIGSLLVGAFISGIVVFEISKKKFRI